MTPGGERLCTPQIQYVYSIYVCTQALRVQYRLLTLTFNSAKQSAEDGQQQSSSRHHLKQDSWDTPSTCYLFLQINYTQGGKNVPSIKAQTLIELIEEFKTRENDTEPEEYEGETDC